MIPSEGLINNIHNDDLSRVFSNFLDTYDIIESLPLNTKSRPIIAPDFDTANQVILINYTGPELTNQNIFQEPYKLTFNLITIEPVD